MKLRKQIKNRVVAVVMLAVVLFSGFWSIGITDTYALTQSSDFKQVRSDNPNSFQLFKLHGFSGSRVAFYNREYACFLIGFISNSSWDYTYSRLYYQENYKGESYLDKEESSNNLYHFEFTYNTTTYYVGYWVMDSPRGMYNYSGNFGCLYSVKDSSYNVQKNAQSLISDYIAKRIDPNICTMVSSGENCSTEESTWQGSQDNPDIDEAIGYLVIKNTNVNQQSDLGTLKDGILPLYFNFDWKDKTSTGFSLTKNKYARTFIQVEVESKFVVYSDVKHTKIKHKFDNYGERGWLSKNIDPSNKPITFDSGDINNALPLTYSEILTQVDKNKIYGSLGQAIFPIGYNFLIRYRIVCTDSLTVIPDTSSGWHAGPWASTTLSGDDINDTSSNKSDHEGYGEDKNKNGETDDINHTRTDYDDNQDAKDNINDKKNDKSSLDLDSAKEFINQVADVPKMIGDLFFFFPNWVKYTVELGFAFIFILIVYKLIRG